jgi:glutamyl-tRNA synthetase
LGWNDGTENELFTLKELESKFSVEGVQKGGARFDYEKAKWVNHQKITQADTQELLEFKSVKENLTDHPSEKHALLVDLVKERLYTMNDLKSELTFIHHPFPYDEKVLEKLKGKDPIRILSKIKEELETSPRLSKEDLMAWAKENGVPVGALMQSFRLALVGKLTGPDLFQICNLLGKDLSLMRINNLIEFINLKLT